MAILDGRPLNGKSQEDHRERVEGPGHPDRRAEAGRPARAHRRQELRLSREVAESDLIVRVEGADHRDRCGAYLPSRSPSRTSCLRMVRPRGARGGAERRVVAARRNAGKRNLTNSRHANRPFHVPLGGSNASTGTLLILPSLCPPHRHPCCPGPRSWFCYRNVRMSGKPMLRSLRDAREAKAKFESPLRQSRRGRASAGESPLGRRLTRGVEARGALPEALRRPTAAVCGAGCRMRGRSRSR